MNYTFLFAGSVFAALLISPVKAGAFTLWRGSFSAQNIAASSAGGSSNLFQSGISLTITPPMKKKLDTRFNVRFDYTNADGETRWNLSPIGNLGVEMNAESYAANLQHTRTTTVTSAAETVESKTTRLFLALFPRDWPRFSFNYSTLETRIGGGDSTISDNFSLFGDYRFRMLNFRGGYTRNTREGGAVSSSLSDTLFFGVGGSYEILRRTTITGDFDISRYASEATRGSEITSVNKAFRLGLNSRPVEWFALSGNFSWDTSDSDSETRKTATTNRYVDLSGAVYPFYGLRFFTTVGNRYFDDVSGERDISFVTLGTALDRRLHEKITLNAQFSRTLEDDPELGENIRDALNLNSTMDLTPKTSFRLNLGISRTESPGFVSTGGFDASGPLTDRALYDDRPTGFTFFDTDNNDLYTKNSPLPADWSAPAHIDPPSDERFSTTKSAQLNLRPTDSTTAALYYSANTSSETLDLVGVDSQNLNGSFSWRPNRRTTYGLSGTVAIPKEGDTSYSGTATFSYLFFRRHNLSLSYGRRTTGENSSDNFAGTLRIAMRKRSSLDMTYSASQLFQDEKADYFRIGFNHVF